MAFRDVHGRPRASVVEAFHVDPQSNFVTTLSNVLNLESSSEELSTKEMMSRGD